MERTLDSKLRSGLSDLAVRSDLTGSGPAEPTPTAGPRQVAFDRSLYLPDAVEAAAAAYAQHAQIELTPTADAVVAEISSVGEHDPEVVAKSFCNHVLHETIVRLRQAALR